MTPITNSSKPGAVQLSNINSGLSGDCLHALHAHPAKLGSESGDRALSKSAGETG